MRAGEVVREAVRDIASGAAAGIVFAVVFAVLVGGTAVALSADRVDEVRAARRWVDAGAATLVERADGRIDGAACDALAQIGSVRASGAVRQVADRLVAASLPRSAVPTSAMSPGFGRMLDIAGRSDGAGILASADVARRLGVSVGDAVTTPTGATRVIGVYRYPDDGRDQELSYAVLEPDPQRSGLYDECWATVWPDDTTVGPALARTVLHGTGGEDDARPTLTQLNPTLGTHFVAHRSIPQVAGGTGAAAFGLVIGAAFVLRRRLALASDRHIGVGIIAQLGAQLVQAATWASVGVATAVPVILGFVHPLPSADATPVVLGALRALVCGWCGVVAGVVIAVSIVRERSLFRYFRQR
jgi:hypothetical protein